MEEAEGGRGREKREGGGYKTENERQERKMIFSFYFTL